MKVEEIGLDSYYLLSKYEVVWNYQSDLFPTLNWICAGNFQFAKCFPGRVRVRESLHDRVKLVSRLLTDGYSALMEKAFDIAADVNYERACLRD